MLYQSGEIIMIANRQYNNYVLFTLVSTDGSTVHTPCRDESDFLNVCSKIFLEMFE